MRPAVEKTSSRSHYVSNKHIFSSTQETQLKIAKGWRNRMLKELQKKYKNITVECITLYLIFCKSCQKEYHLTKYVQMRPLETKRSKGHYSLLVICAIFKVTSVLYSDSGSEFANRDVE
ncbi:hypothetical protein Cfor_03925 [Coptotermes formosanus]|uniref:Uncharacterized protein n=1 Tax=Coptotermes formosanus TaxID=36987 RepID=A0A6L2PU23_COPFO|nr:hypothetical protein Cfor_03925 [Coptotermes formosanus]